MSESLVFEDMELLGGDDFKAVLDQMEMDRVVAALWGCPVALRGRLLRKLTKRDSHVIEQAIAATEHFSFSAEAASCANGTSSVSSLWASSPRPSPPKEERETPSSA